MLCAGLGARELDLLAHLAVSISPVSSSEVRKSKHYGGLISQGKQGDHLTPIKVMLKYVIKQGTALCIQKHSCSTTADPVPTSSSTTVDPVPTSSSTTADPVPTSSSTTADPVPTSSSTTVDPVPTSSSTTADPVPTSSSTTVDPVPTSSSTTADPVPTSSSTTVDPVPTSSSTTWKEKASYIDAPQMPPQRHLSNPVSSQTVLPFLRLFSTLPLLSITQHADPVVVVQQDVSLFCSKCLVSSDATVSKR
ncbi:hypothetical protein BLNAU_3163 [Blattamonas nauphoetae]|uniref:Uncharacterized protein n=1 Tax=Blattamonas nauphoetae TaxID=2049346 RepID=A0ABQ9YD92_9EUKA|nr:hypothetical protein BLNAU_3163 [Blattamonas nauphoetae]